MSYFVYILASERNGTLYIGITNDLARRIFEHKQGTGSLFTRKYGVKMLVHAEELQPTRCNSARDQPQKVAAEMETRSH